MSIADRLDLLRPPVTAARVAPGTVAPSFRRLAGDEWELTTSASDSAAALEELARLDPDFDWSGFAAELVEAKADPAAWSREVAYDENGHKTPAVTRAVVRKRYLIRRVETSTDRADLLRYVLTRKPAKPPTATSGGAFVVCLSDLQIGKVDRNGGTPELLDALGDKLAAAWALARKAKPAEIVIADLGDGCERDENTAQQAYTNDLSVIEQLDLFNAVTVRACLDAARIAPVRFAAIPSNHMQDRRGRERIGPAGDDFGILNARTLARIFATSGRNDVNVVIPERHAESMTLNIGGVLVGMVHGHQVGNPDKIPDWWQGQAFGGQPLVGAKVLLSGHFHSRRIQDVKGGRTWIQAPTMDGGSAWFANLKGDDSRRGLLVLTISNGVVGDPVTL